MKVPYTVVVGDKEIEAGTVSVRDRHGHEVRGIPVEPFAEAVADEAARRSVEGMELDELAAATEPKPTV
jgi:threonyl-tRNA synthetase